MVINSIKRSSSLGTKMTSVHTSSLCVVSLCVEIVKIESMWLWQVQLAIKMNHKRLIVTLLCIKKQKRAFFMIKSAVLTSGQTKDKYGM